MLSRQKKLLMGATIYIFALTVQAAPPSFQATYSVIKSGLTLGEMTANLSYGQNNYTYLKNTKANGIAAFISGDTLNERSSGDKKGEQLASKQYSYQHKNRRKNQMDQFNFISATEVKGRYKDENYQLTVPTGTIDPALLELKIMDDMTNQRPLNYRITEKGKLKNYNFQRQGKETLELPAGKYLCEKIHMIRDDGNRSTTIWLAPELNYVPVKIRHNEKGDIIETALKSYQAR